MGEANSKKKLIESFSAEEKIIFNLANTAHTRMIQRTGAMGLCYYMTFLLKVILEEKYKIQTTAVVGYINDGDSDHMMSHAWLEYAGKKTDLTLTQVQAPNLKGALLILDHKFYEQGTAEYTYHLKTNAAGELAEQQGIAEGFGDLIEHKRKEHSEMAAIAAMPLQGIINHLNKAPFGTYENIVSRFALLEEK